MQVRDWVLEVPKHFIKVNIKHKILPGDPSQMTSQSWRLCLESQNNSRDLTAVPIKTMLCIHRKLSLQKISMFYKSWLKLWNDDFCFYRFPVEANIIKWEYKQTWSHTSHQRTFLSTTHFLVSAPLFVLLRLSPYFQITINLSPVLIMNSSIYRYRQTASFPCYLLFMYTLQWRVFIFFLYLKFWISNGQILWILYHPWLHLMS